MGSANGRRREFNFGFRVNVNVKKSFMIRYATKEDLPAVVRLIMERGKEFDYDSHGFPRPELDVVTDTVYKNWLISPCFVVENDDKIVGCASTTISTFGWSRQPYLGMFMVYVLKSHRNYNTIKSLYKSVQDYATLHGLLLCDDYIAIDRVDGRKRLMKSLGFKEAGFLLTYRGEE